MAKTSRQQTLAGFEEPASDTKPSVQLPVPAAIPSLASVVVPTEEPSLARRASEGEPSLALRVSGIRHFAHLGKEWAARKGMEWDTENRSATQSLPK